MIEVMCVICGYETMLFEGDYDEENGEPCPDCGSSEVAKLNMLFESHPVPVVDGSPALVRPEPAGKELYEDLTKIFGIAAEHEVIEDDV